MAAVSASHNRAADSTRVSSTACRSNVERLMTLRTSAVAVCCWSDSLSSCVRCCTSLNSLTFSIAITAWRAKLVNSAICFSVNGLTSERRIKRVPMASSSLSPGHRGH